MNQYVIRYPDGTKKVRRTDRTYTHAVIFHIPKQQVAWFDGRVIDIPESWDNAGFCSRLDLAQKLLRQCQKRESAPHTPYHIVSDSHAIVEV